jgi:T5SS/PEP-CTERM-associated repeat protein
MKRTRLFELSVHHRVTDIIGRLAAHAPKRLLAAMLAVGIAGLLAVSSAQAAVTYSGDASGSFVGKNSAGSLSIDGADSTLTIGGTLYVGYYGNGVLSITNGGTLVNTSITRIGFQPGSTGFATVDGVGSSWSNTGKRPFYVGTDGNGTLNITNGGTVTTTASSVTIADNPDGVGTANVDGVGSIWNITSSGAFYISRVGVAKLNVTNGGKVVSSTGITYLGYSASGSGTVTIDGSGSSWVQNGTVSIAGTGTLNILNGAAVMVNGLTSIGASGTVNFGSNGGTLTTGSLNAVSSQFTGTGTVVTHTYFGDCDLLFDADHGFTKTKVETWTSDSQNIGVYLDTSSSDGITGDLIAGYQNTGSLTVKDGFQYASAAGYIGYLSGSTGTAAISGTGSKWTLSGNVYAGYSGTGHLFVGDGAAISTGGNTYVGNSGTGSLVLDNGATATNSAGYIGYNAGSTGRATVNGPGSTWTNSGILAIGYSGIGNLSISNGGTVTASKVVVTTPSTLLVDVGKGSSLSVGSSGFVNTGMMRLVANAGVGAGTYTPVTTTGTWTNAGTVQALGGIWNDTDHTVTVSDAALAFAGRATTIDLASAQRMLFVDPATAQVAGMSFLGATTSTPITMTASVIGDTALSALRGVLASDQKVLSAWNFTPGTGYTSGDPVYLSLFTGSDQNLSTLGIWHYDGSTWSAFTANDLAYDGTYASFTVTGFSGYAVSGTAPVPIPAAVWLLGSGLAGLVGMRRRLFKK